ncbi:glycosyltransferase [Agrococcus sp. TSP3-2-1]|uniref:glycosyltransferase n=1 Tax=Agrococcus sp. TSP3-2-1 TaxID=2804583 RepID=UPI003CF10D68
MAREPLVIAHDYLTQRGGAERVVLALTRGFPGAPIQTTLYDPGGTYPELRGAEIRTTVLDRVGFLRRHHRFALPFLAAVVSRARIDADVVIASSSGWAHGFRTTGRKIVYCYSPARWLYQPGVYLGQHAALSTRLMLGVLGPWLRRWDRRQARTADAYIACSSVARDRVRAAYGIEAEVVYPPHSYGTDGEERRPAALGGEVDRLDGFDLCISRLLPYKNVDAVVGAFASLSHRLVVVGAGPEEARLRAMAPSNVVFLQHLSDAEMRWLYARCGAIVAASYEDFGLIPVEAASFGKPSVALRWGGFLDTIVEGVTGVLFDEPTPAAIADAVRRCRASSWDAEAIRAHARRFSEEAFLERIGAILERETSALPRRA